MSSLTQRARIVIVEGNISAGKSTLCRDLAKRLHMALFLEPTIENPFLERYYVEPKKYALPMQLWLLKQRYITYVNAIRFCVTSPAVNGVILDRSIFSDIVFADQNFEDGNFSRAGYEHYLALRSQLLQHLPPPHTVLYLDASPQTCFDRIHNLRQRDCEGGIPLAYLQGLDKQYKAFVARMRARKDSAVLSVDWNAFGSTTSVCDAVLAATGAPVPGDWEAAQRFVEDNDAVMSQMRMATTVPEAGADVAVADPDIVTRKEAVVMPPTPASAGRKRDAPSCDGGEPTATPHAATHARDERTAREASPARKAAKPAAADAPSPGTVAARRALKL